MKPVQAESSLVIDAPASVIYDILSDYRAAHPAICPKQFFASVTVNKGGRGAGTEITVRMTAMAGKRGLSHDRVRTGTRSRAGRSG